MPKYAGTMEASGEHAFLAELEKRLAAGEQVEVEVSLSVIAGQDVELEEEELRAARRRAVQLLAAGGDPRREPEVDGRAVTALAADLAEPSRSAALAAGLASLRPSVRGLPHVASRLESLLDEPELAWRWFACTLLAEELLED
jgi:hypothetical protein